MCPLKLVNPLSRLYIKWFTHYKNKLFPLEGTLLDQPVKYIEAMFIIENIDSEYLAERRKRAQNKR